jgi:ASC-1-like (ASCH) protein
MKSWTLKFRQIDRDNFDELKAGIKSVETRAASTKYQTIAKGDTLIFVCGKEKFSKKITKRSHYKSVSSLLKAVPFKKIMPNCKSKKEVEEVYYSYPNYKEKIKEFGVLAFELK